MSNKVIKTRKTRKTSKTSKTSKKGNINKWKDVLDEWKNGNHFKYPSRIRGNFHWNTSVLKNGGDIKYKESFKINKKLPNKQDKKEFQDHIKKSKNKYVTAFPNLSGDTMLVVPMPRNGKNYATLKHFSDNAPAVQQKEFWKKVSDLAHQQMKKHKSVWISTHGLGVSYLHVRICNTPKYYFDKVLEKNN